MTSLELLMSYCVANNSYHRLHLFHKIKAHFRHMDSFAESQMIIIVGNISFRHS